jgi:hypothetical protein
LKHGFNGLQHFAFKRMNKSVPSNNPCKSVIQTK